VIIRTAGIDRPAADLKRDLGALKKEWKAIQERFTGNKKAGLVHQEPGSIVRVLRDYFTEGIEEVWVDSPDAYQEALGYFKAQLPKFQKRLRLYVGDMSIFSAHNIEDQIEALGQSRVPLRSGGGIVIESTEAMVAIDVNSGKSNQESDIEDTALRTNMEAADEVARQLRLRNLGGLIVVDFIDMFQAKNRSKVQQSLIESLKKDKARTTVGSISQFGLLELSRQRIDMEISVGMRSKCPHCGGTGHIPNLNTSANTVLRKIRTLAASGKYTEIHGTLPLELANHLLNSKRESLRDLELEFDIQVSLIGDPMVTPGQPLQLGGGAAGKGGDVEARSGGNGSAAAQDSGDGRRRRRGRGRGRGRDMEETESTSAPMPEAADDDEMEAVDVDDADRESSYGVDGLEEVAAEGPATDDSGRGPRRGRDRDRGGRRGGRDRDRDSMGGDNGRPRKSEAGEIYVSQHRITHPDLPPPPTEGRRRQSPFKAFAATVESGLLFDSQQPGVTDTVPLPPPSEVPAKVGRRVMPEELGLSPEPMDDAEPMEARYEREEIADDMDDDAPDGSGDDTPPEEETGATEELAAEDGVEEEGSQPESNESAPLDLGDGRRRRRRGRGGRGRGRS
ncbi:MAG TPA: ribonuclease E/G, partial [bacterium]